MKIFEIAKKYVSAGFSVIPLDGKIPSINWKEYQSRFPTEEELLNWFGSGKKNIGIVTGKISGITVVDVDMKSGGLETLKTLGLPITWTVKTGGGGWHYYYKYTPNIQQTAGVYQGIDIRNDGGQVVAPPSSHASGNRYEWTYKEDEMLDFPVDLFKQKEILKKDWSKILGSGSREGSRNATAASVFGKLSGLFQPDQWETTVWPLGQAWNQRNNPPLPENELRSVFESISKRAIQNPRPQKLEDVLDKFETPKQIAKKIKEKGQNEKFFTWGDAYFDLKFPVLEPKTYTVLFGQFSSGKTTFAMFIAKKNAEKKHKVCFLTLEMSRENLVKQYAFKRAGIDKEKYKRGDFDDTIFEKYAKEIEDIDFIGIDEENTKTEYTLEDIEKIIQKKRPDILFIDNFNKLYGTGQSEVGTDNRTSSKLLMLTRKYNTAIIVLHHANKPNKDKKKSILKGIGGMRGTNKINDDADIVVEIGRPAEEDLSNYPVNLSQIGIYKDRNWDSRGYYNLRFEDGIFYEEAHQNYNEIAEMALQINGHIIEF